ncbi:MAG TPA: hypothetical protein VF988_15235 [Verrucomicrobiae bacterium]
MKALLLVLLFLAGAVFRCQAYSANDSAKTITSDGTYGDTTGAVAYVLGKGQDGWVITVGAPGGVYTWTNAIIIGTTNTLTLQGASPTSRVTAVFDTPSANSGIYVASRGGVVTIKDFIFNVGVNNRPYADIVGIDGNGVCFRVSNCRFVNASGINFGLQVGSINSTHIAGPYGVVDHCEFYFPGGVVYNFINARANGNVDGWGWTQPMSWGTTNSVVVEDCAFSQPKSAPVSGLVEADGGARLTIRHNTITNIPESTHGLNSGAHLSTLQVECYQNNWTINDTGNSMSYLYLQRGGTGVIWSNTIASTSFWNLTAVFSFWEEAASTVWQQEWFPRQLVYPADYPATQQVGQGVVNGAQGLAPTYLWGNNAPGTEWGTFTLGMNVDAPFIQQGRDIYTNSVMPNYTPLVYPHPLVASGGSVPPVGSTGGGTGGGTVSTNSTPPVTNNPSGTMAPPVNLQAHPPGTN